MLIMTISLFALYISEIQNFQNQKDDITIGHKINKV